QAIVPIIRRSSRSSGDQADHQAIVPTSKVNLKKQEKFLTLMQVSAESVLQGHQKSVKLARPLD
ncbi:MULTISPECIES: hypothetical protein, partial [unclassified Microcoleus]|uniref:hypothetical protein n=1 Tax=unclassified Microcoleus TaxID=2642155 RepID=UPI002FCE922E